MMTTLNAWGTPIADIDPGEYCQWCERGVPWHYNNCNRRNAWAEKGRI